MPGKQPVSGVLPRQNNTVYCYDGSFEGFLCCVFTSFARRELPADIWPPQRQAPTLYATEWVDTSPALAQRVYRSFGPKLGAKARSMILACFLSGDASREMELLQFLHFAYPLGPAAIQMAGHKLVQPLYRMEHNVAWEADKFRGFLRFEQSEGMLGAVFHPHNYLLPVLRGHFCQRFADEQFVIYDAAHSAALLYQHHTARILDLEAPLALPQPGGEEAFYQQLWKQYYNTMEITARHNESCRRTLCPKRFWADMTELRDAL